MDSQQTGTNQTGVIEGLERLSWVEEDLTTAIDNLEDKLDPYLVPVNEQQNEDENYEMQSVRAQEIQSKYRTLNALVKRLQSIVERFDG